MPPYRDGRISDRRHAHDLVAIQVVTVGPEVTELMARLEREGEFAEQLFTHGLGVQAAEGLAEWLHSEVRRGLGIDLDQDHPQAVYFGMKSGFIPKEKAPDELIAGTERGGELPARA
jgi:5-methyltetrahydrofolate--homocysteine methyltransferase